MSNLIKTAGRTGNAGSLYFNGATTTYLAANYPVLYLQKPFSISVFFRPKKYNSILIQSIVDNGATGSGYLLRQLTDNKIQCGARDKAFKVVTSTTTVSDFWYHVLMNVTEAGVIELYINSVEEGNISGLGTITYNREFCIGNAVGKSLLRRPFDGNISNCKIYTRSQSINEIKLLSQGLPISRTGLVGEWKLNEMSGTTAYDTSGQGNHGTIVGATYSTDKPF